MIMALVAAAALSFEPRWRWATAVVPAVALHLLFTGHRAGWLALMAAAVVAAVTFLTARSSRPAPQTKALFFTGTLAAGGIAVLVVVTGIAAANAARVVPTDISTIVRVNGYYNTARMIQDRPLLGYGPGAYIIASPRYWTEFEQDRFESTRVMNRHVHNEYLESAVAAGLPGSGVYATFLVMALWQSASLAFGAGTAQQRRAGIFFAALFAGFAVDSAFGFNFNSPASGALAALAGAALAGVVGGQRKASLPVLAVGAVVLVVCGAMTLAEYRRYRGEMHYHKGLAHLNAGHHSQAEQHLASAEEFTPWDWRIARERGVARYELGDYAGAIPHFERSLGHNPNWIPTLIPIANAALNQATAPDAMTHDDRQRLLTGAIYYADAVLTLNAYSALGAEALARARYTQAALLTRQRGDAAVSSEWGDARDALQRAIANGPQAPGVLLAMLGQAQSALGEPDAAAESLAAAVRAEPNQEPHWTTLYNFAQKHQRFDALDQLASEALTGDSAEIDRPQLLLWRAIARDLGEREPAAVIDAYRAALEANPSVPEIWGQFGYFAGRTGGNEAYREAFLALPRPPIAGLRALEAVWSGDAPRYAEAIATLEDAVAQKPVDQQSGETKSIRWAAMMLAREIGEPQSVVDAVALVDTGRFLTRAEEFDHARTAFVDAAETLQAAPRAEAWALAAQASLQLGDVVAARSYIDRAAEIDADDAAVQLTHARVLHAEGNTSEAAERVRDVLRSTRLPADLRAEAEAFLRSIAP
jgi:tetratricopeptide (TPR) repeat protein